MVVAWRRAPGCSWTAPCCLPLLAEVASQGSGSPRKLCMQRMGGSCLSDYPWQHLPVTHWAEKSWCQPPQTHAKYIPMRGKKRKKEEGGEKQNIEGHWDRIGQDDRIEKKITEGKKTRCWNIHCLQPERKNVVESILGKNLSKLHNPTVRRGWESHGLCCATNKAAALRFNASNNCAAQTTTRRVLGRMCFNASPWLWSNLHTLVQVICNFHVKLCVINCREIRSGETGNQSNS